MDPLSHGPVSRRRTPVGGVYAWYVLGVLFLVYVLNFVDRQILSILAQDIKAGLGVNDAQIGFLYGTAFAVFYSLFGIPLGRLADEWHRSRLIALGLALWSGMTALSGLANSYAQLAAARIGVGVGEASASPAAYSLLGDYFSPERRATALAIYTAGLYTGAGLSLPIGGSIAHGWNHHFAGGGAPFGLAGWQAAFLGVGIPGLLLAVWVSTLREPVRGLAGGRPAPGRPAAWRDFGRELCAILPPFTLWNVARIHGLKVNVLLAAGCAAAALALWRLTGDALQWSAIATAVYAAGSWLQHLRTEDRPTYVLLWRTPAVQFSLLSCGFLAFLAYGIGFWVPAYAMRSFHVGADVAGWMIGIPSSFGSAAGCIIGGRLSDAWKRRDPRGRIFVCMLSATLAPPVAFGVVSSSGVGTLYVLYPLWALLSSLWIGSGAAIIQDSVLPRMRATAGAAFLLAVSLIGLALGPYLVGRVSVLTGSLRLGILSILAVAPLALLAMWRVSRDLPAAESSKEARAAQAGERAGPGQDG